MVESGCAGTFPLLLMSLDSRVDMKMYTTYPYLTEIYRDRIYTSRYEENRIFETMLSEEVLFRFSGVRNDDFFVCNCTDTAIVKQALAEIGTMMK